MERLDVEAEVFEFATDEAERVRLYGEWLARQTEDPHLKEKIYTLLAGHSVDH